LLCDLFLPVVLSQALEEHVTLATRLFRYRFSLIAVIIRFLASVYCSIPGYQNGRSTTTIEYCDEHACLYASLSLCLSVCLYARISLELHTKTFTTFPMFSMAVTSFSSDAVAISYYYYYCYCYCYC